MRRATLLAMLLWAAPQVATAQATVGDAADEAVMPDVEAPADASETDAETGGASEETAPAAQRTEASAEEPAPNEPIAFVHTPDDVPEEQGESTPLLESTWFWMAVAAVVFGITAAVVVAVTTDDAPPGEPTDPMMMGLTLRF